MSSYISISLKGVEYKVRHTQKPEEQHKFHLKCIEIDKKKAELMILMQEKTQLMVDMLDERQLIIHRNGYNKALSSEELKKDKRYLKQKELLKAYDDIHGTYIEPT